MGFWPSREDTDKMAEYYKGHKDWKGDELNDSGRRLYGLRETAGFTGPIDQDGYPGDPELFNWTKR